MCKTDREGLNKQQISPYFNPTYTRTGWIGQPPVLDRHEVVTIDGDVDTLLLLLLLPLSAERAARAFVPPRETNRNERGYLW